ncbi:MAG: glucosamine-6-phosphate deaminase [Clostridia bacterium]|nr:glucosamine-6-phosphate deaminase [Clostridia bacterium]
MRITVCENYDEMSKKAAQLVLAQVTLKPNSVLGFATGSTPLGLYENLSEMCSAGQIDFSNTVSFNLDEYYPIKKDDPNSYNAYMQENLFSKINIKRENAHLLNGETDDPEGECENYERMIGRVGGIDMQILGIGSNGHIGFNEPDSVMYPYTHITHLTESTIKANSRFFSSVDEVPKKALTVGILTILNSKRIILMANGAGKKQVISELLGDGMKLNLPAALLKLHPDVTLICDKEAYPK